MRFSSATAFRVLAVLGLGVSALLLAEYLPGSPSLCTSDGGCTTVRESAYASFLGVPIPVLGLLYFTVAFGLAVAPDELGRLRLAVTGLGAAAGVAFILLQAVVIEAYCAYCLVADGTAIALFVLAWPARTVKERPGRPRPWVVAAAIAVGVGLLVPLALRDDPVGVVVEVADLPPAIAEHQDPDKLTIVEFMHFGCPHCRTLHQNFSEVLDDYEGRIHFVYKHSPGHHAHGARAACCAQEVGKEAQMVDRLFRSASLSADTCENIARDLGLDMGRFRECMEAPRTAERLARDREDAMASGVTHLPTYWIGDRRLLGPRPPSELRAQIEAALRARAR